MPTLLSHSFSSIAAPRIRCLFVSHVRAASKAIVAKFNLFYAGAHHFENTRAIA